MHKLYGLLQQIRRRLVLILKEAWWGKILSFQEALSNTHKPYPSTVTVQKGESEDASKNFVLSYKTLCTTLVPWRYWEELSSKITASGRSKTDILSKSLWPHRKKSSAILNSLKSAVFSFNKIHHLGKVI